MPFLLALNKADLTTQWEVTEARQADLAARGWKTLQTSAKEGASVEEALVELGRALARPA